MTIWNAIILGLVQGIAEFLPISSSGHLSILQNLFGMTTSENGHVFFDVLLHLATLVSVIFVYRNDLRIMIRDCLDLVHPAAGESGKQQRHPGARLVLLILVATLPLVAVLPIHSKIEELYNHTAFIGMALILTGCMLYVSDQMIPGRKKVGSTRMIDALIIGVCQAVATIPGLSRSGTTITAGLATGLNRKFAVKFSFLLSIPAVLGANLLSLIGAFSDGVEWKYLPAYLVGMLVAMVTGVLSLNLLKRLADRGGFGKFAYYCWGVGFITIILSLIL